MAVSIVLFAGAFLPLLGILVAPFSPLPICILTMKYGPRHGLIVAVVTVGVLSLLFTFVLGGAFIPFVYVGLILGTMVYRNATGQSIMAVGIVSTLALLLGLFCAFDAYAHFTPSVKTIGQTAAEAFDRVEAFYGSSAVEWALGGEEAVTRVLATVKMGRQFVVAVLAFPLAFLASIAALGFGLSYLVAHRCLLTLGYPCPGLPRFSQWTSPWYLAWGMMASYGATRYYFGIDDGTGRLYSLNFLFVFLALYVVMGLAVLEHVMHDGGVPRALRPLLHLFALSLFVYPPVPIVPVLGLLDPWVDFRRLNSVEPDEDEEDSEDEEVPEKGDDPWK